MKNTNPKISVIIPVKNGSATLDACLSGILTQTIIDETEIIIIDSGSSDDTLDLVGKYPVRIHQIQPQEFNHGDTRNLGVSLAKGEFIVMTVQDATPTDNRWLERMLGHFEDLEVSAVCGKQLTPHDQDKNPMQWSRRYSEPEVKRLHFTSSAEYLALSDMERLVLGSWDDVTAMYRKIELVNLPFRRTMFGEDFMWATDALAKGHALVHDDEATVYHYHDQPFVYRFKRMLTIYHYEYKIYNCLKAPTPWLRRTGQIFWHLIRHQQLTTLRKLYWMYYNFRLLSSEWGANLLTRLTLSMSGEGGLNKLNDFFCPSAPQAVVVLRRFTKDKSHD